MRTSGVYTIEFHLPRYSLNDTRRFGNIFSWNELSYEKFNDHAKSAYRGPSKIRAAGMKEKVMGMKPERKVEQNAISTNVRSSS